MFSVLRRPRMVENITRSPSYVAQMTLDCGAPSGFTVDSTANAFASSSSRSTFGRAVMPLSLSHRHDHRDGYRGQPLAAAGEAEGVGSGPRDCHRSPCRRREDRLRLSAPTADLRRHTDHLDRDVTNAEAGRPHPRRGLGQQRRAGRAGPLWTVRSEVVTEIAEPGRAEQRV